MENFMWMLLFTTVTDPTMNCALTLQESTITSETDLQLK